MNQERQAADPARVEAEMDRAAALLRRESARVIGRLRAQVRLLRAAMETDVPRDAAPLDWTAPSEAR